MKKLSFLYSLLVVVFLAGCFSNNQDSESNQKKEPDPVYEDYFAYTGISDDIKDLNPEQLAKLMFEHTDENLYLDIRNRAMMFTQEEYDHYYSTLLDYTSNSLIQKGELTPEQAKEQKESSDKQRKDLDTISREKYGKPMYQLPFSQAVSL